jgi:pimeloyl-ACP methyl ester carboxylesterase
MTEKVGRCGALALPLVLVTALACDKGRARSGAEATIARVGDHGISEGDLRADGHIPRPTSHRDGQALAAGRRSVGVAAQASMARWHDGICVRASRIDRAPGRSRPQRSHLQATTSICGGADPSKAALLKDLPIWTFHGSADDVIPVTASRMMVDALKAVGAKIQYTEYPGAGHNVWDQTYANPDVLRWFIDQHR